MGVCVCMYAIDSSYRRNAIDNSVYIIPIFPMLLLTKVIFLTFALYSSDSPNPCPAIPVRSLALFVIVAH